jgi:non-heme chloroperoxidase
VGYNYDTFAADLDKLLTKLDLKGVSLVGFSMGSGEVTRYIGKYGSKRVRRAVLIGALGPYLVKAADNPDGVDGSVFEGIKAAIAQTVRRSSWSSCATSTTTTSPAERW